MSLTEQEILRYSRHIILPEVGGRGQKKLKEASVLIAGLGSTGSAAALYLAAAGVGKITLWDPGVVMEADLQSAFAHNRHRLGLPRAESAREPLIAINPGAAVTVLAQGADPVAAVAGHQVVVASAGDWLRLQREVVTTGGSVVFAAIHGAVGAALAYRSGEPCLGCVDSEMARGIGLFPEGEEADVAPAAGVMGVVAATEAVKLIVGIGMPLTGRILTYDGWAARFAERSVTLNEKCPVHIL